LNNETPLPPYTSIHGGSLHGCHIKVAYDDQRFFNDNRYILQIVFSRMGYNYLPREAFESPSDKVPYFLAPEKKSRPPASPS
jgi:hypothetical protein